MIVPITGNVTYNITLDPTVWIFDDRKILFENAFKTDTNKETKQSEASKTEQRWGREVYQEKVKPPVHNTVKRYDKKEILSSSYVIPINDFLINAEIKEDATKVTLVTDQGEQSITIQQLENSYLLFAIKGKPVRDRGPVQLYFKDGSNQDNPIKGISEIKIV